ncbi:hypothetical protein FRB95_000553 [Tulasnella sp. JGI-2019a]|nr:hypothetical protein FRB95_000553 [Tulasnella sp. JGI-2019a]
MDSNDLADGLRLVIEQDGETHTRVYRRSDTKDGMIIVGRSSGALPTEIIAEDDPVGGKLVEPGMAAFLCPVMSRQHARLVFGSEGSVFVSDPPDHSHHGTFITRDGKNFRVGHPQRLETGDIITFGKAVHRGGDVYEPLTAKVELLSASALGASPTASFTGRGYGLPSNIDNLSSSNEDEVDEIEDQASHKYFAVEEIPYDDEDIESCSDVAIVTTPPVDAIEVPMEVVQPIPRHALHNTLGRHFPPFWAIPKPSVPVIQSRQPTSQQDQSQLQQLQEPLPAVNDVPWRRMYNDSQQASIPAPLPPSSFEPQSPTEFRPQSPYEFRPVSPCGYWPRSPQDFESPTSCHYPVQSPVFSPTSPPYMPESPVFQPQSPHVSPISAGYIASLVGAQPAAGPSEQERNRVVALEVLKEQGQIVGVNGGDDVTKPIHEVIDADAFPTPEPEVICIDPMERACLEATCMGPIDVDELGGESAVIAAVEANAHMDVEAAGDHESPDDGDGEDEPASDDEGDVHFLETRPAQQEHEQPAGDASKISVVEDDGDNFDSYDSESDLDVINDCLKDLNEKVSKLEGSRNRSKRRFTLHKAHLDVTLAELQKKCDTLEVGIAQKDLMDMNRAYQEKKVEMMNEMREGLEELKTRVSTEQAALQSTMILAKGDVIQMQSDIAQCKEMFMQGIDQLMKAATDKITAEMEAFQAALTSALTVVEEARDVDTRSRKRKHADVEEEDETTPYSVAESTSSPSLHSMDETRMDVVQPVEHCDVTVTPDHGVACKVAPPTKRRRIVRTAAHVLVGGAMVYLGLGML